MAKKPLPTPEQLRQLLDYDPDTGIFVWRKRPEELFKPGRLGRGCAAASWNTKYAGQRACSLHKATGYRTVAIFNKNILAHRVAWAVFYGAWPVNQIDHINHNRSDNRIANLRDVTRLENMRNQRKSSNNKSGVTGVYWVNARGRWRASISTDGVARHLGSFEHFEDAIKARRRAELDVGLHPNHGR